MMCGSGQRGNSHLCVALAQNPDPIPYILKRISDMCHMLAKNLKCVTCMRGTSHLFFKFQTKTSLWTHLRALNKCYKFSKGSTTFVFPHP